MPDATVGSTWKHPDPGVGRVEVTDVQFCSGGFGVKVHYRYLDRHEWQFSRGDWQWRSDFEARFTPVEARHG